MHAIIVIILFAIAYGMFVDDLKKDIKRELRRDQQNQNNRY